MNDPKSKIKILAIVMLILSVTLACGFFPNLGSIRSQLGPEVQETLQSASTEAVGGIQETASALSAELSPEIQATLAALPSQVDVGQAPADIPVIPNPDGFIGNTNQVIYRTTDTVNEAVNFYRQQMPVNGWQEVEPSIVLQKVALLNFESATQKTHIAMIPGNEYLAITIIISQK
jgi:hypothetical protein